MEEINLPGVGKINVIRSRRAKRLNISVQPFKGVRVSVPVGMSYKSAAKIVHEKSGWIINAIDKVKLAEQERLKLNRLEEYETRDHRLVFTDSGAGDITAKVADGLIEVKYPKIYNKLSDEVQFMARKGIVEALRIEAKKYLPGKVEQLAQQYGFSYNRLALKNIKSRWGSCSRVNNINLSVHLMTLPDHLIDYVILHELVHTKIKNHSKKFWSYLDKVCRNARRQDKELKKYRIVF